MNIMHRISVIAAIMMEVMSSCSVKTVDVAFGPNVKDYTPVVVDILKEHPKDSFREGSLPILSGTGSGGVSDIVQQRQRGQADCFPD